MKQVGEETHTPVIDLYEKSAVLFNSLGEAGASRSPSIAPDPEKEDRTHFSQQGASELAKLIAASFVEVDPRLAQTSVPYDSCAKIFSSIRTVRWIAGSGWRDMGLVRIGGLREDGMYHMFASRWSKQLPMFCGYILSSEIVACGISDSRGALSVCREGAALLLSRCVGRPHGAQSVHS